jgi:hypothetical protein
MRLAIEVGGVIALARLHVEDAPAATRRFVAALPFEGALRQSRWSGETTYVHDPTLVDLALQRDSRAIPSERPRSIMCAGDIHYGPARGNIGLAYGQAQSRAIGGENTWGVHVATVERGLEELVGALRTIRVRGPLRFVIRADAA